MVETDLSLRLLGDLEVIRAGQRLPLPPSRKTRALLAYLALQDRPQHREHLCELLWEIPDDPRGSLRWSLSKIRGLVDSPEHQRIQADRNQVRLDTSDMQVDVLDMHALAVSDLTTVSTEALQEALTRWRGNFLDGLELTNFYGFYAWCAAERERVTASRARLLGTLVDRLENNPAAAVAPARQLVLNSPYDQTARARLIRLLRRAGNADEAEQQYHLGLRLLREVGGEPSDDLRLALRTPTSSEPATGAKPRQTNPPAAPGAAQTSPPPPQLAGREEEIASLSEALTQTLEQQGARGVLLTGAPGMGKSRLLRCARQLAEERGATVLAAAAYEPEILRPFALWGDLLQRHAPEFAAELFSDAGLTRTTLAGTSREGNRDRLMEQVAGHVLGLLDKGPVVLLLDDFQWADESSAQALGYLAGSARQRPLLVIAAAREGELNDNTPALQVLRGSRTTGRLRDIRLGPLPPAAVIDIIGDEVDPRDRERLSRECNGNPLLARVLARAIAAGGQHHSLDAVITDWMAGIGLERGEVLRWVSLFSNRIDVDMLATLTGLPAEEVGLALEMGVQRGLLTQQDFGFRFTHDLLARGVYKSISPTRQAIMHRKAAELLEKDTALDLNRAADLAHHASQSGDAALAARALVLAGRLCLRFFANQDALSLARRGLQMAEHLGDAERVCLSLDFHSIMVTAAPLEDWENAARTYNHLAEQALDHGDISHARLGYYMASYLRWYHGHWQGAREETLQAERITRGGSEEEHIIGLAETAKCLAMLEQDLPRADAMLREARALAERRRLSVRAIPVASGILFYHEGELDAAEEQCLNCRALAKPAGDRINEFLAHEYLVMIAFERGNYRQARERSHDMQELAVRFREGSEAPFAAACNALCDYALDDCDEALDTATDALRAADAKHRLAYVLTRAALLDNERGRPSRALPRAGEALHCAQVLERATETLLAHLALAEAHRQLEQDENCQQHRAAIADMKDAPVAQWARARAQAFCPEDSSHTPATPDKPGARHA